MLRLTTHALILSFLAVTAQAATVSETDFAGGFGSANQNVNPDYTAIGSGFDVVNGTSSANSFDFIQFTDLAPGPQTVSLTLSIMYPGNGNGNAFSDAGGELRYSTTQTTGPYTNNLSAGSFNLVGGKNQPAGFDTTALSFSLDNSFAGGDLFVNILQTSGNRSLAYSLSVPGNASPAAVPLPGAGWFLAAAFGLLIARRSRGRGLQPGGFAAT